MTRRQRRGILIVLGLTLLALATGLVLSALQTKVTFFKSPMDVAQAAPPPGTRFRLGGIVAVGSLHREPDGTVTFNVTDGKSAVPVRYKDVLPDLFREGQGVVAEGEIGTDGVFAATTVLAKHDEKYMPPEVAAALKKSGRWQEQRGKAKTAPQS